jgi:hypothetical protein
MNTKNPLLFLLATFTAFSAQADWEGKVEMSGVAHGSGTLQIKNKKMRLDLTAPAGFSVIADMDNRKAVILMPALKVYMQKDVSESELNGIPLCDPKNLDACLTEAGYRKVGHEKANGYPCTVYEGDLKPPQVKNAAHAKLWKVDGMKETPLARVVYYELGKPTQVTKLEFSDIQIKSLPEARFVVPKDFSPMPNADAILKSLGK